MNSDSMQTSWIQWLLNGAATIFSALSVMIVALMRDTFLTYRKKFDDLQIKVTEIDKYYINHDEMQLMHKENQAQLQAISEKLDRFGIGVIVEKLRSLEDRYESMHEWKSVGLPQYIERQNENLKNLIIELSRRIEQTERK